MRKIWHPWWKWECCKAGFYTPLSELSISKGSGEKIYQEFLANLELFESSLLKVISEWVYSCEHFLTDTGRNRIAWLGQASVCYTHKIPFFCRGGFRLLSIQQQRFADDLALKYLKIWEGNQFAIKNCPIYKNMEIPFIFKRHT